MKNKIILPDNSNLIILPTAASNRISPSLLTRLNTDQKNEIISGINSGIDVSVYAKPELDHMQMRQVRKALENGFDFARYARPEFSPMQMDQIMQGIQSGIDVSMIAHPGFEPFQMKNIRMVLEAGANREHIEQMAPLMATREIDDHIMSQIRRGISNGVNIGLYARPEFSWRQMKEIRMGLQSNAVDTSVYANPELDYKAMEALRLGMQQNGLSPEQLRPYSNGDFDHSQINVIIRGILHEVDMSVLARPELDHPRMEQVLWALQDGVDIEPYANTRYTGDQIHVIAVGLRSSEDNENVDVSVYDNPEYSFALMTCTMMLQRYGGSDQSVRNFINLWNNHDVFNDQHMNRMDWGQKDKIMKGYSMGLDVSRYAHRPISSREMDDIVAAMRRGVDIDPYIEGNRLSDHAGLKAALRRAITEQRRSSGGENE
jgi:hypothetical protein